MRFFGQASVDPGQFSSVHFLEVFRGNIKASTGLVAGMGRTPVGFGFLVKLMLPDEIFHILVPESPRNKVVVEIEDGIFDQVGMERLVIVRGNTFKEPFVPVEPADILQK